MKDTGRETGRPEADLGMPDRSDRRYEGVAAAMADHGDEPPTTGGPEAARPPAAPADRDAEAPEAEADTEPADAVPPQKPREQSPAPGTAAGRKAAARPKSNPWAAPQPGQQAPRPTTRPRPAAPSGRSAHNNPAQRPVRPTPTGAAPAPAAAPADPRGREVAWYAIGSAACLVAGYALGRYENRVIMTLTGAGCGLVLGLWAVVRGTWINAKAGPDGNRAPVALGAIAGGLLVALLSMMLVVTSAIIYPERRAYETCMSGANTLIAQQICSDQYDHSLRERGLPGAASIGP